MRKHETMIQNKQEKIHEYRQPGGSDQKPKGWGQKQNVESS